jgi:drug/metabolite transporter (DMT)-like permease
LKTIKNYLPYIALVWLCIGWGTTWVASKEGVEHMPAFQLVAIRQFMAAIAFLLFFVIFKKMVWPNKDQWKTIIILCFLNFICSNALSTWGVKYISSGLGAIIGTIFPLFLVGIQYICKEFVPKKAIYGLLICFAGICVVFYDYLDDFLDKKFVYGILASVTAAFTWALCSFYTRRTTSNYNPYCSLGIQMLLSSIIIYTVCFLNDQTIPVSQIPIKAWQCIIYLVFIGSIITFVAFIYALQNLSPTLSSTYAYINPIVAILLGYWLFDEKLTINMFIGVLVILFGLFMVNRELKKHRV